MRWLVRFKKESGFEIFETSKNNIFEFSDAVVEFLRRKLSEEEYKNSEVSVSCEGAENYVEIPIVDLENNTVMHLAVFASVVQVLTEECGDKEEEKSKVTFLKGEISGLC